MRNGSCETCAAQDWNRLEGAGAVYVCFQCRTIHWRNGDCDAAQAAQDEEAFQAFLSNREDKEEWEQTC